MSNVDINVDRRTDGRTDGRMDGRTENRTPISHPATSRCDKKNRINFSMLSATNWPSTLSLLLLNTTCPVLANSVDQDQLASEEAN